MGCFLTGGNGRDVCEAGRPGRARLKCEAEEAWRASGGGLRVRWESCSAGCAIHTKGILPHHLPSNEHQLEKSGTFFVLVF